MTVKTTYIFLLVVLGLLTVLTPGGADAAPIYFLIPPLWAVVFVPSLFLYLLCAAPTILSTRRHALWAWGLSAGLLSAVAVGPYLAGQLMTHRALAKMDQAIVSRKLETMPAHVALTGMDPTLDCAQICRLLLSERGVMQVTVRASPRDGAPFQTYELAHGGVCHDPRASTCIVHGTIAMPVDLTITLQRQKPDARADPGLRPGYLVDVDVLTVARSAGPALADGYGATARVAIWPGILMKNLTTGSGFNPVPYFVTEVDRLRELDTPGVLVASGLFPEKDRGKLNLETGAYQTTGPGQISLRRTPPDAVEDQDILSLLDSDVAQFGHPARSRIGNWVSLSGNRTDWQDHDIALMVRFLHDHRSKIDTIGVIGKPVARDARLRRALMKPVLAGLADPERRQAFAHLLLGAARAGMQPADLVPYAGSFRKIYLAAASRDALDPLIPLFGMDAAPATPKPKTENSAAQPGLAEPPQEMMGRALRRSDCVPDLGYCRHIYLPPGAAMPDKSPVTVTITPTN